MTSLGIAPLTRFDDPGTSTAPAPPESRGLARDGVRLLVAGPTGLTHARFSDLGSHLEPGDLVVVNNSATLAAEFDGTLADRGPVVVHAAAEFDDGTWVVELRTAPDARRAILDAAPGDQVTLKGLARLELLGPHPAGGSSPTGHGNRLWRARVGGSRTLRNHMLRHGRPIAYGYLNRRYPLADYQSVFGVVPGSAEMPSAGRPFTPELVTSLVAHGIGWSR